MHYIHRRKRYPETLTDAEVLKLLKQGIYCVSPETAEVRRGGRLVTPFICDQGRAWVRLYSDCKRRAIARAKLVWMARTLCRVPKNFEIHHNNEDTLDDSWPNLVCLHELDHRKLHHEVVQGEIIPF